MDVKQSNWRLVVIVLAFAIGFVVGDVVGYQSAQQGETYGECLLHHIVPGMTSDGVKLVVAGCRQLQRER